MDPNLPVPEPPIETTRAEEVQPKLENVEEIPSGTTTVEAESAVEIQAENGLEEEERAVLKRKSEDERPEDFKKMFLAEENAMQVDHVLESLKEVCEPDVKTLSTEDPGQSSSSSQSSEMQPEFYVPQIYEPEIEKIDEPKEESDDEDDDDPSPPLSQPDFTASEIAPSDTLDIQEKLREMGEISVKPVSKNDPTSTAKRKEGESEISVEIKKKAASSVSDKFETEDSKRITNLRKNIREVMDENQLDATTLAAQRQESERLARVQVQQKIIRELQRQMVAERQNNRTQNRVLSLLQGQTSLMKSSTNADRSSTSQSGASTDMYIVKGVASEVTFKGSNFVDVDKISSGNLTPSVSIAPVRRAKSIDEDSGSEEEEKKEVVTIVDSSSEDDCIVLSDDDEEIEEEPEDDPHNSGLHVKDAYNIPDEQGRVVINIGHPESEDDIFLAPQIARIIKPHQIGGVRFLFDNIIESVERFDNSTGFGCILAHSMGLGKTLQIVCFCDIFLRHTSSKSVLCIMPINTLQNWMSEFNMWLPEDPEKSPLGSHGDMRTRNFKIFVLNDQHKTLSARSKVILEWSRVGGVLLIGYELYRLLSLKLANKKKKGKKGEKEKPETEAHKRLMEEIHSALVRPGPDLVICDEGHRIKNSHASISVALKQIRSKRRIVLTGYPLQNNLLEYWCMVDFVRPNYLGTKTEFANMFERPIQNGQCIDSTPQDIKLMRYRAHVLHSLLVGFVQRRSHVVLQNSLPQKEEYVILVRMTEFQRKLYDVFMNEVVRTKAVPNPLKAFAVCCKIWNHPDVLYNFLKKREADLDLELEEVETEANATATTATTAAAANNRGRKKGPAKKAKEVNKDGKTIPAIEVQPNQGKMANENAESLTEEITPKQEPEALPAAPESQHDPPPAAQPPPQAPPEPVSPQQPPMQNHHYPNNFNQYNPYECDSYYGQQYGNMYPPQPAQYPNHHYDQSYMPNPDNYWQGNYYGYGNTPNPIPLDPYGQVEPSYASLVPKATESFEKTKPPSAEEKSSEIVDLDTKEIKTVEPTIIEEVEEVKEPEPEIKEEAAEELAILPLEKETIRSNAKDDGIPYDWAVELMKGYVPDLLDNSPKMVIFFRLLEESLRLGDRILVFSQSLLTLNLIERFLQKSNVPGFDYHWAKNTTYFRLDGSTTAMEREKLINEFNSNPHIHLFLVSTRAGSLGINLVGANRVIVLDASWNPCHDTQAVCRVYRYGQKKPCFVYRIVMDNCLEKKIYDRQVNKQGMSDRVVDECNPDAHLSMKEVTNLCYDNEEDGEVKDFSDCKDKYLDIVMQKIIELHYSLLSKEPFHHESLLVDRKEKKLSQAEKRLAQRGYEMEKRATAKPAYVYHSMGTQYRVMRTPDGAIVHRPVASVRPMQAESGEKSQITRPGGVRPTRWIPAEVWQRQGMTAQEMTLPLDVVIPTSSGDKANIVLKAGQKVMVLKSPKGIYMQLETGKIIAIRTSFKMGQHNKDKSDDSEAGSSNLTSPEDLLLKATKGDQSAASPIHHSASNFLLGNGNSKKDDLGKTNLTFPTGKHGYPFEATNRSSKLNEPALHGSSFKSQSNSLTANRNYPQHSTPNSKHFNVQSLIEGKGSSSGQHSTNVYPHAKGHQNAEDMLPENNRSSNSFSGTSKSNLFNSANKAHYPRSNYSFTNALKQAQSHGSQHSLLANVKPHIHENKLWEQQHKAQQALKNATSMQHPGAHAPTTITIDDDLDPPLREKVVYKPNLVERKPKMQNSRSAPQNSAVQNFGKQPSKNTPPQTSSNLKSSSSSDSLRQLQNVKPYNRQYPDQRNGSTTTATQPKPVEESPPAQQTAPAPAPPVADVKSSPRPKMPAIRNIPAPYPSICVPHINSTATSTTTQSTTSYTQSNLTATSQDIGQHSSRSVPPSFTGHNTQQRQENTEYSLGRSSDKKPENIEPKKNSRPTSETTIPKDKKLTAKQPPASAAPPQPPQVPPSTAIPAATQPTATQPAAPTAATPPQTTPSAAPPTLIDPQYPSYNQPAASTNPYAPPAVPNDPNYNYSRPEPTPYQQPYPDMYGSAPANNYAYPAQHQPPPQNNYPYGSYYDPQMYGNLPATNSAPNYGNPVPPPPPPTQHQPGQFHPYPNYHQPPSAAPPHTPDPYNSYYNYPPYPPQTGQWQQ